MPSFQTAALIAATFFCLLVLSFPSMAQQPATNVAVGPGIVSANLMGLVTHPAVQKELKMTYEQKSQLKRLSTKEEEQRLQWFQRMGISRTERAGYLALTPVGKATINWMRPKDLGNARVVKPRLLPGKVGRAATRRESAVALDLTIHST